MVDILLATYNGEKYIEEQLDSLLNQTYKDIRIIIRDDASRDNTLNILQKYAKNYPDIIHLANVDEKPQFGTNTEIDNDTNNQSIENNNCISNKNEKNDCIISNNHGATYNFMKLMTYATGDYVMFCDQDDYWFPDKVEMSLKKMQEIEAEYIENNADNKASKPILIYSDYRVVDSSLHTINVREKHMHIHGHNTSFNRLLVQNYVTGCTMMINKALYQGMCKQSELPYSEDIIMHDWFIALYAAAFGIIYHIPYVTMLYRQHGDNVYGAVSIDSLSYIRKQRMISKKENLMNKYYRQAGFFKEQYGYLLEQAGNTSLQKVGKQLDEFLDIKNHGKAVRIIKLIKGRFLKGKFIMKLGQILKV